MSDFPYDCNQQGISAKQILKRVVSCDTFGNIYFKTNLASNPPPAVLYDGSTVAWYLSDEPTTITMDVANRVSRWNDFLASGHDLIQANGADQPLWSANGVLFDGESEYMKCTGFPYVQPEMIYIVFRQITWVNNDKVFDGNVNNRGALVQSSITPEIRFYNGAFSPVDANLVLNTFGIVRVLFNGANSMLQINNNVPFNGAGGVANMQGFTLGANGANLQFGNIEAKEIILRDVADGAVDQTAIYNYLSVKYGI